MPISGYEALQFRVELGVDALSVGRHVKYATVGDVSPVQSHEPLAVNLELQLPARHSIGKRRVESRLHQLNGRLK